MALQETIEMETLATEHPHVINLSKPLQTVGSKNYCTLSLSKRESPFEFRKSTSTSSVVNILGIFRDARNLLKSVQSGIFLDGLINLGNGGFFKRPSKW